VASTLVWGFPRQPVADRLTVPTRMHLFSALYAWVWKAVALIFPTASCWQAVLLVEGLFYRLMCACASTYRCSPQLPHAASLSPSSPRPPLNSLSSFAVEGGARGAGSARQQSRATPPSLTGEPLPPAIALLQPAGSPQSARGGRERNLQEICTGAGLQRCLGLGLGCIGNCSGTPSIAANAALLHTCNCDCLTLGVDCGTAAGCSYSLLKASLGSGCTSLACTPQEAPVCSPSYGGIQTCGNTQVLWGDGDVCARVVRVGVCSKRLSLCFSALNPTYSSDTSGSLPISLRAHAHPRLPDVLPQVQPFCRVLDSCNDTCTNGPDANTTVEGLRSCRCACVKTGWQCSVNAGCSPTQAASVFAETCAAERCAPAECAGPAALAPSPSQRPIDVPGNTR
jgi:hypothetical protein